MRTFIRMIGNSTFWIAIYFIIGNITCEVFGVYFYPPISFMVSCVSVVFPAIMDMGVDKYAKSNIYDRVFPIIIVLIILYSSKWFTPTVIVAVVNSYYLGVATSYLSKILTENLGKE